MKNKKKIQIFKKKTFKKKREEGFIFFEMIETENILLVDDITFLDVEPGKVYTKNVKIENTANVPVDFTIRGSKVRYQIEPESIPVLNPGDSVDIRVTLKVPSSTRITKRKNTDVFHIRTKYFVQRFSSTWCLKNQQSEATNISDATSIFSTERESWRKELLSQLDSANKRLSHITTIHQREMSELRLDIEQKSQNAIASCLAKDREIEELKKTSGEKLEEMRKQMEHLRKERDETRKELRNVKTKFTQTQKQNENKIKSLTTRNESLRTRLEASTSMRPAENKALQEQLDQVERNAEKERARHLKLETESADRVSELERKLEKAMENCNPTDRETFLEEKIRALHDTMRLVGAVSKGDSDDDLVSIEDENEIDDMASSLLTYKKDETLSRRVVFAQAFEILKLRQQLVKVQSNYTEDVPKI